MQEDGRFIPPGPGRVFAFSRNGGFGRSRLLAGGLGMLGAAAVLSLSGTTLLESMQRLVANGLIRAGSAVSPGDAVALCLGEAAALVGPIGLAAAVGTLSGALIPALIARRGKGTTAVPLPSPPAARFAVFAVRLFGALVLIAATALIFREAGLNWTRGAGAAVWLDALAHVGLKLLIALGLVSVLTGAAELLLLRHAMWRALFLNRSEHRRELRASEGARDIAARGRRRLLREDAP